MHRCNPRTTTYYSHYQVVPSPQKLTTALVARCTHLLGWIRECYRNLLSLDKIFLDQPLEDYTWEH